MNTKPRIDAVAGQELTDGTAPPRQRPNAPVFNGASSFTEAAERVVDYLNSYTPLTDWSVSKVLQGEQIHVHVHEEALLTTGPRVT